MNQACNAVGTAEGLCVNATAAGEACTAAEGESVLKAMFLVACVPLHHILVPCVL